MRAYTSGPRPQREQIPVDDIKTPKVEGKIKTFDDAVNEVTSELKELMVRKQADYGHQNITDFGEYGVLVKANDKICRLKNLLGKKEPKNESIEDSWIDLANYAIIALMLRKGTFTLPLKEEQHDIPSGENIRANTIRS